MLSVPNYWDGREPAKWQPGHSFHTSTDEQVIADSEHFLSVEAVGRDDFPHPIIHVRHGLSGLLSRAVFYRLAEIAVEHELQEAPRLGVFSSGIFFPLD